MKQDTKTAAASVELQKDIDLGKLYLGSEAPGTLGLDVRKSADDPAAFATLKASIAAVGIIQPLIAVRHAGKLYVVSGNRRLRALRELTRAPVLDVSSIRHLMSVPTIEIADAAAGQLRELAVMANLTLPMHPVDQFEVIAGAIKARMSVEDIAARWGVPSRRVRQIVALGGLAPEVREAWRKGEIDAKTAQTFTLGDIEAQTKVFAKLRKQGRVDDWQVKQALVGNKADVGKLLAFVGLDAYRIAGGKVREDLFGVDHVVDDRALVKQLATAKIDAVIAELTGTGWAWAIEKPNETYMYGTIEPAKRAKATDDEKGQLNAAQRAEPNDEDEDSGETAWEAKTRVENRIRQRSFSEAERKRSGCFVSISSGGVLEIDGGRVKPEEKKAAVAKAGAEKRKEKAKAAVEKGELPGVVSNALIQRMSEWLTAAAAEALKEQPQRGVAFAALIAGIASRDKTVDVRVGGLANKDGDAYPKLPTFESVFKTALALTGNEQLRAIDSLISDALDFAVYNGAKPLSDLGVATLVNAIEANHMHRALKKHIDFGDYFASISKPMILAALREGGLGEDGMKAIAPLTKTELAAFAVNRMQDVDWFPPELRPATYKGVGACDLCGATPSKKKPAKKRGAK